MCCYSCLVRKTFLEYDRSGIYRSSCSQVFFKMGVLKSFRDIRVSESFLESFRNIQRKTPVSESLFDKVAGLEAYNLIKRRLLHRCFPVNIAKFLRAVFLFFYRTPLMAASGFLTKLAENYFEGNRFSVEFFSEISYKLFLSLSCCVSKNNSFTGFSQFLSYFEHVRGVSRIQSNIKMEPFAKINDSSRGVLRTESKSKKGLFV